MKQYASVDEFARDLPGIAAQMQDKLQGNDGTFCLKLKDGRNYSVELKNGLAIVSGNENAAAECTVTADEKSLLDMINGKLSPVKALLFGKVGVKGDVMKLKKLMSLL